MIIYSIQPKEVLSIIESGKSFRCDARKSFYLRVRNYNKIGGWDSFFHKSYAWMAEQMKLRNIQKDNRFPVWGWYRYHSADKNRKAPRLRQLSYAKGNYRLKLSVPDNLVLLSNFDLWHNPINDMFCGSEKYVCKMMSIEDNKTWSKERLERLKLKSWENIFKFKDDDAIQACFPSIEPEYILKTDIIK